MSVKTFTGKQVSLLQCLTPRSRIVLLVSLDMTTVQPRALKKASQSIPCWKYISAFGNPIVTFLLVIVCETFIQITSLETSPHLPHLSPQCATVTFLEII